MLAAPILVGMVGPANGVRVIQPTTGSPDAFPAPFLPAWGAPQGGIADTLAFLPADPNGVGFDIAVPDPVSRVNYATLLVLPADQMVLGVRLAGDSHPRWVLASDAIDGLMLGDGGFDPTVGPYPNRGSAALSYWDGQIVLNGPGSVMLNGGEIGQVGQVPDVPAAQFSHCAGGNVGTFGVYVTSYPDPNAYPIHATRGGDLCVVTDELSATPGVWQATAAGAGHWKSLSGGAVRQTVTYTTTVTAIGGQEQATVVLAKSYRLLRVTTDVPCRVRLYTTAANQSLDTSRTLAEDPAEGSGVVLDYETTGSPQVFLGGDLSPEVTGASMEATPAAGIPITVDLAGPGPAHINFTYFSLE